MSTTSKYKWTISLILGGILLILAMTGGKWDTAYSADASINANPVISTIYPIKVAAGSGDIMMIISGANFGQVEDFIRVWIKDSQHDYLATPSNVIDTVISVVITDTLLVNPDHYTITVVKSNGLSVPTVPPDPIYDQVSNPVDFFVFESHPIFLPIISK